MYRPMMASAGIKPPSRGSSSSNPITLTDPSKSSPSSPNATTIPPSTFPNPQHSGTSPHNLQYQENDAPWQVHRAYTSEIIQFVESLFKAHPVLHKVAGRHPCLVRKIVRAIQTVVHWELNRDPHLDWVHSAETLFSEIASVTYIHPLVACAFNLPYVPSQDIHPILFPLRQELYAMFLGWVEARHDPFHLLPRMLSWIHFSMRELSTREFQHAMIFSLHDDPPRQGNVPTVEDLNSIGGGFIQFSGDGTAITVLTCLRDCLRHFFNGIGHDLPVYHARMGLTCLAYVHLAVGFRSPCPDDDSLDQRLRDFPLLPYAVENWRCHIEHWHYHVAPKTDYMEKSALYYLHNDNMIRSMMQIQGKMKLERPQDRNINQDLSQCYYWNITRLSYAASIGSYHLVAAFLNRHCHPNENIGIHPPLVSAATKGYFDVVSLLLNHGADVNAVDFAGRTALYVAVFQGHFATINILLSASANVNCQTTDGMTPLMAAICNGNLAIAGKLLQFGAKVYLEACDGQTALSYALLKPEFSNLAVEMFELGANKEFWQSNPKADITLYEAIMEIKDSFFRNRVIDCIQQLDKAICTRASSFDRVVLDRVALDRLALDCVAWSESFVRKLLDEITACSDLSAVVDDIAKKRRALGMILPLSNNFRRRYMLDRRVGKGAFSSAWKAIDLVTGRIVAVKFLLSPKDTVNREDAFKECKFMSDTNHPNILKCLDSMTIQGDPVLVTEFAEGGDLWHYLAASFPRGLCDEVAKMMFRQIMEGLSYLHAQNVVHRDLKSLNILVFEINHVKIADFGNSKRIPAEDQGYVCNVPCTPTHVAPEAINDEQASDELILAKPCDVYSAGVCLYELLAGKEPFNTKPGDKGHEGLHRRIRRGDLQFDDHAVWGQREDLAMHLIARMMNSDPKKRPTAEQVLTHPWLTLNPARQSMLDFNGLRVPHVQKPESFNSQRPEWITPRPRTRRGDHSYSEDLEEGSFFTPLPRQRRAEGSLSEDLEQFRMTGFDFSVAPQQYRL